MRNPFTKAFWWPDGLLISLPTIVGLVIIGAGWIVHHIG